MSDSDKFGSGNMAKECARFAAQLFHVEHADGGGHLPSTTLRCEN